MPRKPYTLFKRSNKKNWYCRFYLPDGSYKDQSTGYKTRKDAEAWAFDQAKNETPLLKKAKITLSEYARSDFFAWDGVYCRNRRATGKRINEAQAQYKTAELTRLIIPYFGNYKLTDISEHEIEKFRNYLLFDRNYAGSSVNKVLSDLQSILKQAKKDGIIKHVPDIEKVSNAPKTTKGVLTQDEVRRLFADENSFPDYLTYCASLLASCTGLRLSEVMAVQLKNINSAGYIEIEKSWNIKTRTLNTTTKSGKVRRVVIPRNVQEALQRLLIMNPYGTPDSFLS